MSTTETILALDPGIARTGYAVMTKTGSNIAALNFGCIETSSKELKESRLQTIYNKLTEVSQKYKPTTLVLEKVFLSNNQKTVITVGQAQGVMLLVASQNKMAVSELTPLQIKQAITGYGNADKRQVEKMMMLILKLKEVPKLDDTADALACGLAYFSFLKKC